MDIQINRRKFLKDSGLTSAGLVIGFCLPQRSWLQAYAESVVKGPDLEVPNAFVKIAPDNTVTLIINKLEMGQGIFTSMAQLIAEELEVDWKLVRAEAAPVNVVYNHTFFPMQMTGGSTALTSTWMQYRRIGAMAREMLVTAAAQMWGVLPSECRAEFGQVLHLATNRKVQYGEIAIAASRLPKPDKIELKPPQKFKVIGKSMQRLDAFAKSTGQAIYGLDVRRPGMLYAVIARPPVFGATLESVDATDAKKIRGVQRVVELKNKVAVLATNTWVARQGRDALKLKWKTDPSDRISTDQLFDSYRKLADQKGILAKVTGNAEEKLKKAKHKILAEFEFPYLAHATMEPMNCTIDYDGKKCEMWAGHQMPTSDRFAAAQVLGLSPDKVSVHTVFAGGSFGRRANKNCDYVVEAAELAKIVKKPLQVVWTREDDMKGGYYRPLYVHKVESGVDKNGSVSGWKHTIVGQSVVANSPFEPMMVKNGVDVTTVEGVIEPHYHLPDFELSVHTTQQKVPTLWWRSVGSTHTAFVVETMIDELAHVAKTDPMAFKKTLLKNSPRHIAVIEKLEPFWHKGPGKGRAFGFALHQSFNSVVGHIAEVSIIDGKVRVHKVVSAVHCGTVVNPDSARMQIESSVAMGLSMMLYNHVPIQNGEVSISNFHDYPVVRMNEMPKVVVHFVKSDSPPTGLGEPGLPPLAPAIANAIFVLKGKRIRKLPLSGQILA